MEMIHDCPSKLEVVHAHATEIATATKPTISRRRVLGGLLAVGGGALAANIVPSVAEARPYIDNVSFIQIEGIEGPREPSYDIEHIWTTKDWFPLFPDTARQQNLLTLTETLYFWDMYCSQVTGRTSRAAEWFMDEQVTPILKQAGNDPIQRGSAGLCTAGVHAVAAREARPLQNPFLYDTSNKVVMNLHDEIQKRYGCSSRVASQRIEDVKNGVLFGLHMSLPFGRFQTIEQVRERVISVGDVVANIPTPGVDRREIWGRNILAIISGIDGVQYFEATNLGKSPITVPQSAVVSYGCLYRSGKDPEYMKPTEDDIKTFKKFWIPDLYINGTDERVARAFIYSVNPNSDEAKYRPESLTA